MTQPTFGQLYDYESMNQHGIIPNGFLWKTANDPANGGTVWMAYDPIDGNWLFNETNVLQAHTVYGPNGEILIYQLTITDAGWHVGTTQQLTALTSSNDPTDLTSSNYYQCAPSVKTSTQATPTHGT
jgi:hypothetical protein